MTSAEDAEYSNALRNVERFGVSGEEASTSMRKKLHASGTLDVKMASAKSGAEAVSKVRSVFSKINVQCHD
jgi:hypothetical protein